MDSEHSAPAFWFPGQGSQSVGMLQSFSGEEIFGRTWAEAGQALDFDLASLVFEGPEEKLRLTENAQPALLVAGVILWRLWRARGGVDPCCMAGHSLGEFTALVCADALDFADAVRLVRLRGRFMQEAVPVGQGGMIAVLGLDDGQVEECCAGASATGAVETVNYNAPGQVVIAGEQLALEQAAELCRAAGARRTIPLSVSAPFHTGLMRPAGERLREELGQLKLHSPRIPVFHNVHARTEADPKTICELLVRQIYSPVRWTDCVQEMLANGMGTALECGPAKVLCGLGRRIDRNLHCLPLDPQKSFEMALASTKD